MTKKEKDLLRRICEGDKKSTEYFKQTYTSFVYRLIDRHYLSRMVDNHVECGDTVMQEVLEQVLRLCDRIKNLEGLIFRIAKRKIAAIAKQGFGNINPVDPDTQGEHELHGLSIAHNPYWKPPRPPAEEPVTKRKRKGVIEYLKRYTHQLTNTQFYVIDLWTQCHTQKQIAELRGTSESTVCEIMNAGMQRIYRHLHELQDI